MIMEQNKLEQDNIPEEHLDEEAEQRLANKPSPRLQAYLDKYEDIDFDTAKQRGVHGVKKMLEDYKSGALQQKYPYLPDDKIVDSVEKLEAKNQYPGDGKLAKLLDIPFQATVGAYRDAAQSVLDLGASAGSWGTGKYLESQGMDEATVKELKKSVKGPQLPNVRQPKSMAGDLARGVFRFLIPFGVIGRMGKAAGLVGRATSTAGKFAEASAVGVATDFIAFGEHEKRLSDLIESHPELSNPVTRYLKSKLDDGVAEGRFKNALEGLLLGTTIHGVGNTAQAMFHAVKWIRNTKILNTGISKLRKDSERRTSLMNRSYDELIAQLSSIPVRTKQSTTLSKLRDSAKDLPYTKEDLLSGKLMQNMNAKSTQAEAIKSTLLQEQAVDMVREAIPDYRARIDAGDTKALDDYWGEMMQLHRIDFLAKDIAAKHGGEEAMVFRRHNTAVEKSNAMYKIFENVDKLDMRRMVEAHMHILESRGDINGYIDGITMSKGNKIKQVIKNMSMAYRLSSPATHWKNIVSTSLNGLIMSPLEHGVAAGIGSVRRTAGSLLQYAGHDISRGFFSRLNDTHRYRQSMILFHSMFSSHVDAIKYLGNAIRGQTETAIAAKKKGEKLSAIQDIVDASKRSRFDTGITRDDITQRTFDAMSLGIEKEGILGTPLYCTANLMGYMTKQPGRLINTYDDGFKGMFFKARIDSEAYRIATNKGIYGKKLKKYWSDIYNTAIYKPDIEAIPSKTPVSVKEKALYSDDDMIRSMQKDAVRYAEEQTYTSQMGKAAESMKNFRDAIDDIMPIIPGGTLIMPFIKTPANLLKYFAYDRGPLLLAQESFYSDLRSGGRRAEMAMARFGTGVGLMGLGFYLKANGYLFGDGPKNLGEKALFRDLGIPERSIRIGGTVNEDGKLVGGSFHDIGWLDPISSFLTFPANIMELADAMHDDMDESLTKECIRYLKSGVLGLANTMLSKSYMQGLSEFITAITDQDKGGLERFFKSQVASTLIPNAVTFVGNQINPEMQAPDTLWETIKVKAGFNIDRPRRDVFGRKIVRNPLLGLFTPVTYSNYKNDETIQELIVSGAYIQQPKRSIENVRLTADEYDKMMSYMEQQDVYGQLNRLVKTPVFNEASNSRKAIDEDGNSKFTKMSMIQTIYRENLKVAKERLVSETPELQNKILDFKLKSYTKPARSAGSTRLLKNIGVKVNDNK